MIKANTKDRTIFGELSIGLVFNDQVSTLDVHINEARNLTGVDGNPPNWLVLKNLLIHCHISIFVKFLAIYIKARSVM